MKYANPQAGINLFRYSKPSLYFLSLMLLLLCLSLIYGAVAEAQQIACPQRGIEQITDEPSGNSEKPSVSGNGKFVAFESRADINGGNDDGNDEVYLANILTGDITQITSFVTNFSSEKPSVNGDGTRVAFQSRANINGNNPDNVLNVYLFDSTTGIITQITDVLTTQQANEPSINGDGTLITFRSNANFTGGNGDGSTEIWVFNTTNSTFIQLTDNGVTNNEPAISADGTKVVFQHSGDGNVELFIADVATGVVNQLTNTEPPTFSVDPEINGDGTLIVFRGNRGGTNQIFLIDTTTSALTQITNFAVQSTEPFISADGKRIAFKSTADINGGNPDNNNEIYIFDTETGKFTQITVTSGGNNDLPSLNADGTRVGIESNANINGGNPDQTPDQIYVALCLNPADGRPIPTLSEWGLIAMAVALGIVGLLVVRRRMVAA